MTTDREVLAELVAALQSILLNAGDTDVVIHVARAAAARARLALPEAVPARPEFIVSALGDRVFDGDEWYEELLADWRRKYVPNPPSAPQINAPALPIAALSDDQIDDISELAWFNAENETACHGTADERGDWSAETELLRYGRHLARAIVDQINAPAGTPALPSREVTGSLGAPVNAASVESLRQHCHQALREYARSGGLAAAYAHRELERSIDELAASQQPPSSRGAAASQPASSAEEDESLG